MTRQLEHINSGSPCSKWFREKLRDSNTGLDVIDIDTIIYMEYDYKNKYLMLVEEKARGDKLGKAQQLAFPVLNLALKLGCKAMGIKYLGFHTIRMDGTRPDNSKWIMYDGKSVTQQQLVDTLNLSLQLSH